MNGSLLADKYNRMSIGDQPRYESDEKLIIALDFGTTFSGIAYCFTNRREPKIYTIGHWPGAKDHASIAPKVPTVINYDSKDEGKFTWGAQVDRTMDSIVGVKLLLDPTQERPIYLPPGNVKRKLKKLPKEPVLVAKDFISAIYRHALSQINNTVPNSYFMNCKKEFVLSVPAVWSDAAKNATLKAARIAGISPVTLIKEPEAAALYTIREMDFALQEGDAFVVCDAGGGTVDLISYEVAALEPLQVKELVPGTGGMAGSMGLNQRFVDAVKELVGEEQWFEHRKENGFFLAEEQFDREVKPAFRGDPEEEHIIKFPMIPLENDPDNGLVSGKWRMTGKDLKAIFDPLVNDILRLIDDQIKSVKIKRKDRGVTGIFLVGGFGSSQYLKLRIEKQHPQIQVLQPNEAWAAIVKGAALSKLPGQVVVKSTCATKHYGVKANGVYDPRIDVGVPICRISRDGRKMCERMTWYVKTGDDIERDQKIKFSFSRDIDENYEPDDLVFVDTLFQCEDPEAPIHPSKGEKLEVNCSLTSDLRAVPESRFTRRVDTDGENYFRVSYDMVVSLESALMTFSVEIDGKQMGAVEAKF